jgi:putative transposase
MPRHARFTLPQVPLHVWQRGVDRMACFHSDDDRRLYLGLLQELAAEAKCAMHAYVLMTNHVHLLLTPMERDSCADLMKNVGQRYTQHCNRTWGRTGTLWEGRFKSSLVETETYLLRCHRYIELNPVRAGMVRCPAEYAWSSFRANAYGVPCPMLTPHHVYRGLGGPSEEYREGYRGLFDIPMESRDIAEIRAALHGGFPLGSSAFIEKMESLLGRKAGRRRRSEPTVVAHRQGALSGLSPV